MPDLPDYSEILRRASLAFLLLVLTFVAAIAVTVIILIPRIGRDVADLSPARPAPERAIAQSALGQGAQFELARTPDTAGAPYTPTPRGTVAG